ncbi:hypothetical protein JCGZ_21833 [Jatropha curcas]|uniref:DNA-directed RNA polymerase subunit n=1 Tax=Jatropha curcas TaxID=180498 RepID=A0A067JC29_JATCU|nr:DNA-directed RNA polymerase III subunit RPC8 [Jatropha curcas]XP_037495796.1 DNA-directed RNA polymerase III subunit RPC8 [Jatropha curcas]KDP21362.1 hypothetical protein JCGZ_21833 [Jatropha curcas]
MFYLSLVEHTLRLPPYLLSLPLDDAIKKELENIFLDKVISNLGLCISIYDLRNIEGGFIFPGDGASTYTVKFRMVVFRPFVGETIVAKLKESKEDGLRLSLGFFDDIHIPAHRLPKPCHFVPNSEKRDEVTWIWDYPGNEDAVFSIDGIDEIKFKVDSVKYPPVPLEQQEKPFAPMMITGAIDDDGLGPVSWW